MSSLSRDIGDYERGWGATKGANTREERIRAIRHVSRRAYDVADAKLLLEALGLDAEEARECSASSAEYAGPESKAS